MPGRGAMAGVYRGRESIFRFLARLPKETDGTYGSELLDVLTSGQRAAALYRARGTRHGRTLELDQVLLFTIEGGLVREVLALPSDPEAFETFWAFVSACSAKRVSEQRFADGLRYRIEIPSVEGPRVLEAVLEEAASRGVDVRRVSQGSGVMMLTDDEISAMARLGAEAGVEVSLFLGPRGAWDTGGQSLATAAAGGSARGDAGVEACVAEVRRGTALGIRSFLVADLGVLATLGRMKRDGALPRSMVLKTSVLLACANAATARTLEELGATTINVATDLAAAELGELRAACSTPLDVYVEVPDDQGGFVRFYDVPDRFAPRRPCT